MSLYIFSSKLPTIQQVYDWQLLCTSYRAIVMHPKLSPYTISYIHNYRCKYHQQHQQYYIAQHKLCAYFRASSIFIFLLSINIKHYTDGVWPAASDTLRCMVWRIWTLYIFVADRWRKDETEVAKETSYSRAYYVHYEEHCDDDAKMQCALGWVCGGWRNSYIS